MAAANAPGPGTNPEAQVRWHLEQGQRDAAATLAIEWLSPEILAYLRWRLDEDEAQDALSHFSESLWKALTRFRWECPLRAWSYRLARHAMGRIVRRPHRRREAHLSSSVASHLAASVGTSRLSTERQGLALLRAALDTEDHELLTLRIDRELEWEEVAVVLETTSVALRKRYERLTRRLEQMAREQGLID